MGTRSMHFGSDELKVIIIISLKRKESSSWQKLASSRRNIQFFGIAFLNSKIRLLVGLVDNLLMCSNDMHIHRILSGPLEWLFLATE